MVCGLHFRVQKCGKLSPLIFFEGGNHKGRGSAPRKAGTLAASPSPCGFPLVLPFPLNPTLSGKYYPEKTNFLYKQKIFARKALGKGEGGCKEGGARGWKPKGGKGEN